MYDAATGAALVALSQMTMQVLFDDERGQLKLRAAALPAPRGPDPAAISVTMIA